MAAAPKKIKIPGEEGNESKIVLASILIVFEIGTERKILYVTV